jgi:H+/Cl- antiporter ClcA
MTPLNLFFSLALGLFAGALSYALQFGIESSEALRNQYPEIVLGLPVLFFLTVALKKKTLYYPYKIKDLFEMTGKENFFWNRYMSLYHFIGASLSHFFGASVGREGVVVLTTTGIVRFFNLSLTYWGPVAASIGFAAITGNKWVGLVFLIEMYTTELSQKLWTFLGAWVAILLLDSLQFPHLLSAVNIPDADSYFKRFLFVFILGILLGYIGRIYKSSHFFLANFFQKKNIFWAIAMSVVLGYAMYNEVLRPTQSLSLDLLSRFSSGSLMLQMDMQLVVYKLIFTLLCVSLGFFGGEFVPLVVVGTGLGVTAAQYYGENLYLGAVLGAFSIFAGVTRLKWTAMVLCWSLVDFSSAFWVYFFFSVCQNFSGPASIYYDAEQKNPFKNFNFAQFHFRKF